MKPEYIFPAIVAVALHAALVALIFVYGKDPQPKREQAAARAPLFATGEPELPAVSAPVRKTDSPADKRAETAPLAQNPKAAALEKKDALAAPVKKAAEPMPEVSAVSAPVRKTDSPADKRAETAPLAQNPKAAALEKEDALAAPMQKAAEPVKKVASRPAEIKKGRRVVRNFGAPAEAAPPVDDRIRLRDGELASWLGDRKRIEAKDNSEER